MKVDLSESKRKLLADKIIDLANYAMAGLVFGSIINDSVDSQTVLSGIVIYLTLLLIGFKLSP